MSDWDTDHYQHYQTQRERPFLDLLDLLPPSLGGSMLDLGCGNGRRTRVAADRLGMERVVGVDSAPAMVEAAEQGEADERFSWRHASVADAIDAGETYDVVISNATLQFVDDHADVIPSILKLVEPGGWIAIHVPYNHVARTHLLAEAAAASDELAGSFGGFRKVWPQQRPEIYARLLKAAGFERSLVQLRTYRHALEGTDKIVEWMSSGGLKPWLAVLDEPQREAFLEKYARLVAHAYPLLDDKRCLLDYTRLFIVAQRPSVSES